MAANILISFGNNRETSTSTFINTSTHNIFGDDLSKLDHARSKKDAPSKEGFRVFRALKETIQIKKQESRILNLLRDAVDGKADPDQALSAFADLNQDQKKKVMVSVELELEKYAHTPYEGQYVARGLEVIAGFMADAVDGETSVSERALYLMAEAISGPVSRDERAKEYPGTTMACAKALWICSPPEEKGEAARALLKSKIGQRILKELIPESYEPVLYCDSPYRAGYFLDLVSNADDSQFLGVLGLLELHKSGDERLSGALEAAALDMRDVFFEPAGRGQEEKRIQQQNALTVLMHLNLAGFKVDGIEFNFEVG